jgi:HAD superfamily hydrolase (TIGR01484 family)
MHLFSDVLLTVDFDRTLTDTDGKIPQRNLEAIHYFMENGGSFTINTGRSTNTMKAYMDVPVNAPLLLYNGSAAWENGQLVNKREIDLPVWETLDHLHTLFPDLTIEVQAEDTHYFIYYTPGAISYYENMGWDYKIAEHGQDMGPFLKFTILADSCTNTVSGLYMGTEEEFAYFDRIEEKLAQLYGDKIDVFRACSKLVDMHAKGVSKLRAARDLQARLGKKILVCVGDAENDLTMLRGADYAFCPSDGVVAAQFPNVCSCDEGAVADVIYKKIPEILQRKP